MNKHIILKRVIYSFFFSIQAAILGIRLYVRYKREVQGDDIIPVNPVYLVDLIFRFIYFCYEMVILYIFFRLFQFFLMRKLELSHSDNSLTTFNKVIIALVFLSGFFNLEQTISSIVYSAISFSRKLVGDDLKRFLWAR